jgi:hypothetical protein
VLYCIVIVHEFLFGFYCLVIVDLASMMLWLAESLTSVVLSTCNNDDKSDCNRATNSFLTYN